MKRLAAILAAAALAACSNAQSEVPAAAADGAGTDVAAF